MCKNLATECAVSNIYLQERRNPRLVVVLVILIPQRPLVMFIYGPLSKSFFTHRRNFSVSDTVYSDMRAHVLPRLICLFCIST